MMPHTMDKKAITRRHFLRATTLGAAAAAVPFHAGKTRAAARGRIVMLGFDGMAPELVEAMLEHGALPNMARLRAQGGYHRLTSSIPPQSPVAWNSYAMCRNPGGHNIFDFIRRNPRGASGPVPLVGTGRVEPPTFDDAGNVTEAPAAVSYSQGTAFWRVADLQGKRGKILNIPFAFPPDTLDNGVMLSGLGVPDLRGATSTYFALSDSFTRAQLQESLGGGQRVPLAFDGEDTAVFRAPGPRDTRRSFGAPGAYTETPIHIRVNRTESRGSVECGGKRIEIVQGAWSDWLELSFVMSDRFEVRGITRFFPTEIGDAVRLYMACVQYHPDAPYTNISAPPSYASELNGRFGLYKTVGWAYDTHALRQNDMGEDAFLDDVAYTMSWREQLTLDEINRGGFDLLLSAWTATDRVGHMFWRFMDEKHPYHTPDAPPRWRDAIRHCYKRADTIVGRVMAQLQPEDLLFVFSDHGFDSWRTGFNLNTWLHDNGYLAIDNPHRADAGFLQGIDWRNTRAYVVGLSSLYLNIQGRETGGIVDPGAAESLAAEIRRKLLEVKDPNTGARVFSNLYMRNVFHGQAEDDAPDLSLGYARYYQNARQCARGGVGGPLFEPVEDKWSGEHASTDYVLSAGVCFSNRDIEKTEPHIQDLGVTALQQLGVDIPSDYEGDALISQAVG